MAGSLPEAVKTRITRPQLILCSAQRSAQRYDAMLRHGVSVVRAPQHCWQPRTPRASSPSPPDALLQASSSSSFIQDSQDLSSTCSRLRAAWLRASTASSRASSPMHSSAARFAHAASAPWRSRPAEHSTCGQHAAPRPAEHSTCGQHAARRCTVRRCGLLTTQEPLLDSNVPSRMLSARRGAHVLLSTPPGSSQQPIASLCTTVRCQAHPLQSGSLS